MRRLSSGLAGCALLTAVACSDVEPDNAADPSGIRALPASNVTMAVRLADILEDRHPALMAFRNDEMVAKLRAEIDARGGMPDFGLEARLAMQLLYAGDSAGALEQIERLAERMREESRLDTGLNRRILKEVRVAALLRLAEQRNCIEHHTIDSCLLPIRGRGVHTDREPSRAAAELCEELLAEGPSLKFRWLLNLARMTTGEYPEPVPPRWRVPPEIFESDYALPRFRDVAAEAGVAVVGLSGGAVMDDFNGDGRLDLVASSWGVSDPLRYFENRGERSFVERTSEALLEGQLGGLNLIHGDYDNDGNLDLLVLRGAWLGPAGTQPNSLLRNRGDGTFEDVTERAGLLSFHPTQTAAWADFDGDGWLDLFVGNEASGSSHRCELYRNNGDGTFENVAPRVGLNVLGFVKGAVWGDYDNDGRPDLYLSRFGEPNLLFRNDGPGGDDQGGFSWRFADVTARAGVANPKRSFPAWFFDYDNDGWLDLLVGAFAGFDGDNLADVVADYLGRPSPGERCRMYRNRGDGSFEDVSAAAGVDRVLLAMGANFGDIDNDGWLDVYFGTGEPALTTLVPNVMLRNAGGRYFQDVTTAGGFGSVQKGHGIAFGDFDDDGDQDIYTVMGGAFSGDVYRNILFENPGHDNRWVTLELEGTRSNRSAIGARVRIVVRNEDGRRREIHRVVGSGGSFGASSLRLEVGLGTAAGIERIDVDWPGGRRDTFTGVPLEHIVALQEDRSQIVASRSPR